MGWTHLTLVQGWDRPPIPKEHPLTLKASVALSSGGELAATETTPPWGHMRTELVVRDEYSLDTSILRHEEVARGQARLGP